MDLDFDRFIQDHFSQLDALENARLRDDNKGENSETNALIRRLIDPRSP
jgi:hypothetical protein